MASKNRGTDKEQGCCLCCLAIPSGVKTVNRGSWTRFNGPSSLYFIHRIAIVRDCDVYNPVPLSHKGGTFLLDLKCSPVKICVYMNCWHHPQLQYRPSEVVPKSQCSVAYALAIQQQGARGSWSSTDLRFSLPHRL